MEKSIISCFFENSCIYAETTLKTYVKLKICYSSLQLKYEELLKCITPYHSERDMYKYGLPFKKNSSSAHFS